MRLLHFTCGPFVAAAFLAACASGEGQPRTAADARGPRPIDGNGGSTSIEDTALEVELGAVESRDDAVRGEGLRITVHDGIASLDGRVRTLLAKQRALATAKDANGVRAVIDRVELERPIVGNADLAERVVHALAANDVTAPYAFSIEAQDGIIHVAGDVGSWRALRVACDVAAGIPGVLDVRRSIAVHPDRVPSEGAAEMQAPPEPSTPVLVRDGDIRAAVLDAFAQDPRVGDRHPDVGVRYGNVTLEGVVPDASVRQAAEADAENTVGVTGVRDEMTIEGAVVPSGDTVIHSF